MIFKSYSLSSIFIRWQIQNIVLLGIIVLIVSLLIYLLFYMYFKSANEKKQDKWRWISDLLIRKAIFYDDEEMEADTQIPVTDRAEKLMHNKYFRALMVSEIMSAKKSISGTSSDKLIHLYIQLGLEKYALKNLYSSKWYIKAKAIQELTVMEMKEHVDQLYLYANDQNELVRMEAQSALVQFNGFEGLRFLDTLIHPVSNWQQINLLQQLSHLPPSDIDMSDWFKSYNSSVVVLALKLARNYQRFELHDAIISCLDHEDPQVRLEAIQCLTEIYTDETADHLISRFINENLKNQLAIIKVIQVVGTENSIPFMLDLLTYDSDEIKIYAARALAQSSQSGLASLVEYSEKTDYSLNEIVLHIKAEMAA